MAQVHFTSWLRELVPDGPVEASGATVGAALDAVFAARPQVRGYVPAACRNSIVLVPVNYAAWLWSWPDGFINRMRRASTEVFVVGRYDGAGFSSGIDSAADLKLMAHWPRAGIWTNRIDRIAPLVKPKPKPKR